MSEERFIAVKMAFGWSVYDRQHDITILQGARRGIEEASCRAAARMMSQTGFTAPIADLDDACDQAKKEDAS